MNIVLPRKPHCNGVTALDGNEKSTLARDWGLLDGGEMVDKLSYRCLLD
jgi:hypothetical protein